MALSAGRDNDDASFGIRLLADCRTAFDGADRLATKDLIDRLVASDESPWGDLHGHEISPRRLARMLRIYDVHARKIRVGEVTARGYLSEDFYDAWRRYLPEPAPLPTVEQAEQAEQ